MRRSFYTLAALVGLLSGVALYLVWQPALNLLLPLIFLCVLAVTFTQKQMRLVFLFVLAIGCGLIRSELADRPIAPGQLAYYNGQQIVVEGVITQTDIRREKAKYTISVDSPADGKLLISTNKYPQYNYGDLVRVSGQLEQPGDFDGFSYENYLSRYSIYSVMYRPRVEVVGSGEGNWFWHAMTFSQNQFSQRINRIFPEPHASFEAGLLVGSRKGIPPDLMERFNITGLTHIIAISGYNITIIIAFVMSILAGLPRRVAFFSAVGAIILFTLFVGASPAVVRASIMGILGLLALQHGRQNNIHITILASAALMVLWNPKILWWDVGFQLSFAAVMGLIYVAPLFEKYSQWLPEQLAIRESIQLTLAAQVMALPIIVFNFERLSLISPLANLLVAFAIPPAMLFGFLAVLSSFFLNSLSLLFGYITWGILSYIIKIIDWMAAVPYASVDVRGMTLWMFFGYYILLALFLVGYAKWSSLERIRD